MKKHFVTFYSPGTFLAETTEKPIRSWNPQLAKRMAAKVTERYGAIPYGFRFTSRTRGPKDLDSKVSDKSCFYFINCKIETLEEIEKRGDPRESTLISNMKCNGWDRVATTINGWRWTQPIEDSDVVLS